MAINRISGNILQDDLVRGSDLAIQGNLIYFDITNNRVGIRTSTPADDLDVVGILRVGNVTIDSTGNISAGNVNINDLAEPVANSDAATKFYADAIAANANIGNFVFANNTITLSESPANITITPTGDGLVQIDTDTGLVVPVGDDSERPTAPPAGTVRFNTDSLFLEVYNGSVWDVIETNFDITSQVITPDGVANTFVLDQSTDTEKVLLAINGVTQVPTVNYTVSGNVLTMAETPLSTDIIDVRFISPIPAAGGTINTGAANRLAYYAESGTVISDSGSNLTWDGSQLSVLGNITSANIVTTGTVDTDDLTMTGTVTGDLIPAANITYDLGNATNRWNDLWLSNSTIYLGNATISANATAITLTNPEGGVTTLAGETTDLSAETITATGNITANYFVGNGSQLTGIPESYGNANVADYLPTYTGNLAGGNLTIGNVTANYFVGNGSQLTGIPESYGNANVEAYLPTYTGNLTIGNITANYFVGNGSQLTGIPESYGNANVEAYLPTYTGNLAGGNISTAGVITVTGNVTGGNLVTSALVSAVDGLFTNDIQVDSLGVGTAASGTTGEIRATNNVTAYYSDERLKTKLGDIENALEKTLSLSGFFYEANEVAQSLGYKPVRDIGVSAQQVQVVLPEAVVPAPISDKYLTVRYEKLVPLLIEAIKELSDQVKDIKRRMD